jgi:integrase
MAKKRRGAGEGSITQRKSGRWMARYRVELPDGRRVRKTLYGANRREVADDSLSFGSYLDQWLGSVEGTVKPLTYANYERIVRVHLKPGLGRVKLPRLGAHHLAAYYRQKLDAGLKPASVRLHHAVASRALRQAHRWQLIRQNPAALVDAPRPKPKEITPLTQEQARALLAATEGDALEALWVVLLSAGPRIGEALALRWEDLNLDTQTMRIGRTLSWEKGGAPRYGMPKGGKGRSVQLTDRAVAALRRHRLRQAEQRLAAGALWHDGGLVFTTSLGRPLRRDDVDRRLFKPLLRRAGLPTITLHTLRHTAATLLLSQGTHPVLVQHLLGHSTVAMTLDKYSHWTPSMGEQTATAMEAALS